MRKELLILVAASFASMGFAGSAFAAGNVCEVEGVGYESIQACADAIADGATGTIKMIADNSGSGLFITAGAKKNITIDLDGRTVAMDEPLVGSSGTESQNLHLEMDNTIVIKDGTLKASENARTFMMNYADLTLTNVIIDTTTSNQLTWGMSFVHGNVLIDGASSILIEDGKTVFDVDYYATGPYVKGAHVTIDTTGEIQGIIEVGTYDKGEVKEYGSSLTVKNGVFTGEFTNADPELVDSSDVKISGGTFAYDMTEYLAEGLEQDENGKVVDPSIKPQENPKTGDGVVFALAALATSVFGLLGAAVFGKN